IDRAIAAVTHCEAARPPEAAPAARAETVHQLLDGLRTNRSAAAIVDGAGVLTYEQLDRRANQLAHHLIALGATTEARVGIYLPRSAELAVAMLAVLKAGAAYVPLDPSLPRERLRTIVADAGVRTVVTLERLAAAFAPPLERVLLDRDAQALAGGSVSPPEVTVRGENAADVLCTWVAGAVTG